MGFTSLSTNSNSPRVLVRVLGYGLFLVAVLLLAVTFEAAGYAYLKYRGLDTYRFLLRESAILEGEGVFDRRDSNSYLDPHLSHSHDPSSVVEAGIKYIPGFAVYGDDNNPEAMTIVVLGGSTTDPLAGKSWSEFFAERLESEGYAARVLNGGVAGYTSNQELLKLIRDVLPLMPDLILSLNGVNDLGFLHSVPNHPMVHPYQRKLLRAVAGSTQPTAPIMPNAVSAVLMLFQSPSDIGINLGTEVHRKDFEHWQNNVRSMHALANEFGIPYICFLQPVLGVGEYQASDRERGMLEETIRQHAPRRDYLSEVHGFYDGARKSAEEYPYIADLVDLFAGHHDAYSDSRHQTQVGRELLGNCVFDYCMENGLLESNKQPVSDRALATQR